MSSSETIIIIPCYNEELRLKTEEFQQYVKSTSYKLLFVNDGSKDGTLGVLQKLQKSSENIFVLNLEKNQGKGNAVRLGLLEAIKLGADKVCFLDADLSTPLSEMTRLIKTFEVKNPLVVMGSRIALLGNNIRRKAYRHYLGRLFATIASMALGIPVYDTQCGAKIFKVTEQLKLVLASPFTYPWVFDVELIGRLLFFGNGKYTEKNFLEVPLEIWEDVHGSKLKPSHMVSSGLALVKLGIKFRKQ